MVKPLITFIIPQKNDIFYAVKEIPFAAVLAVFLPGTEIKRNKVICPFHAEKTPSFHIYQDSGYCFSCNWHGDSIDLICELEGLQPFNAACMIAQKFGLPTNRPATIKEGQQRNEIERRSNINKLYKEFEEKAFLNMADFRSLVLRLIEALPFNSWQTDLVCAVQRLPVIDHYMMILAAGSQIERLQLLRDGVLTRWAKLSHQNYSLPRTKQ